MTKKPKLTAEELQMSREFEFVSLARKIYDDAHKEVMALHRRMFLGKL